MATLFWTSATGAPGPEPARQADALQARGDSLLEAGDYAHADSVLKEVVELRRATAGSAPVALADALISQAKARRNLTRLEEAAAAAQEGIAIRREHLGAASPELADALYEMALILTARGSRAPKDEVVRYMDECLVVRKRAFGDEHRIVIKTRVAIALRDPSPKGQEIGTKVRLLRACLADQRRVLGQNDPDLVETLFWLSEFLKSQGEGEEALDLAQEALAIERRHRPDHPDVGFCLNQVATIHTLVRQYAEAVARFEESVALQRRTLGPDAMETSLAEANLATAYANAGNPARADSLLLAIHQRALRARQSGRNFDAVFESVDYKRAWVAERAGRFADAESLQMLVLRSEPLKRVPETHTDHQRTWTRLGRARAGQGDWAGAEAYLNEAVRLFESARSAVGSGTAPATFDETPYEVRALVRLELGRFEDAWRDVEASRGRLLGEGLAGNRYEPFPLERVQASLNANEAIVGWVDHHLYYGGGRSWAYVIRKDGPVRWERLARDPAKSNDDLERRNATFRGRVVAPGSTALALEDSPFPQDEARSLWTERFAPVERHLDGIQRLVLIPSSAMGGVPLGALADRRGRRCIERWALRYSPSATLRTRLVERGTSARPRTGLFVGDPPMREQHLAAGLNRRGLDPATVRGALRGERVALGSLPRLRWTRSEVQSIATLFPSPRVLVGEAATDRALSQLAQADGLAGFDVVHLATHALIDGARPERSALVLSQIAVDSTQASDGILTAREISEQWKLGAELVTLSACETALGRDILGEGTVGFAYPLIRSGAKSVLASLWSVNDESSELLMRRFYANWMGALGSSTSSMDKADALRDAQVWVRDWRDRQGRQPFRHPYYWAAFILIGN